jgi:hypothetical protein
MSVKDRLKKYVTSQGLAVSTFEKSIGVSNGYVNSISKGIGGEKLILIIEKYPNLNIEWLLVGKGEMLKDNEKKGSLKEDVGVLKGYISTQQKLIDQLEKEIKELKKARKSGYPYPHVAEPDD